MEERLICVGIALGAYAWVTRRWTSNGNLDRRWATAAWHCAFYALAGFAIVMVGMVSLDSRRFVPAEGFLSSRQMFPSLLGAAVLGAYGFWSAWSQGGKAESRRHFLNEDLEWAETVCSAVILAGVLMYFVVQAFKIPSGSMESTLLIGDHLFVNKFIYGVRIPFSDRRLLPLKSVHRGDIVVFRFPTEDKREEHCGSVQYGKDFIKRVVGVEGDRIEVRDGTVWINGTSLGEEPYVQQVDPVRMPKPREDIPPGIYQTLWEGRKLDRRLGDSMKDNFGPVLVPSGSYFMMGDNRDRSCDGRYWGPVQKKYLKGKAWVIYWPPSRMGGIR
jgi:signal peptidase I